VIRHDNKTAAKPTVAHRTVEQERNELLEDIFVVEHTSPALHANRQQIRNIAIAIRPEAMESAESARQRFV
jgi:hypothetical protein